MLSAFLLVASTMSVAGGYETNRAEWGTVDGSPVSLYTVRNPAGAVLKMTDFGAKIVELHVPDRRGQFADIVLGFDKLEQYLAPNQSMGATIGRYANRIRDGRFEIDGTEYQLTTNEGQNTLHGAGEFEQVVWDAEFVTTKYGEGLRFHYLSPDGTHGFPGNLETTATYTLTPDNAVRILFEAESDKATHVNLTQHSYFNLNGAIAPIHDHVARIDASQYIVLDGVLATGEIDTLDGKPWDLSKPTRLGDNLGQIPLGGYHHDYVVDKPAGKLGVVARVADPQSGRTLTVSATQPDITFYVAMGLSSDMVGKYGIQYGPYMAFCLETQHPVDAANHPGFTSTLLRPGDSYRETVVYDFGLIDESSGE